MQGGQNPEWLKRARLIDELVRREMRRMGLEIANPKSFDELVASGDLKAAECRVLSMSMVDPGWRDHPAQDARRKPSLAVVSRPEAPTPDSASPDENSGRVP